MSASEADATDPASDAAEGGGEVHYQKRQRQSSIIVIIIGVFGRVGCTVNFRPQPHLFIAMSSHSHICTYI